MATVSPSPDSAPSGGPPLPGTAPPLPGTTPPQPSTTPPPQGIQPAANPPDPSTPSLPSPPPNATPPSNSGTPPVTPPPVESPPPTTPSASPPSVPVSPPPTPDTPQTPPPIASPPPTPSVSAPPPQTDPPPVSSPPPTNAPPPSALPSPPTGSPPPTTSPPPPSSTPPPTSSPTPPSSNPPVGSPPPSSSKPPESSPPPPAVTTPPPQSSPSPPTAPPPRDSPPSSGDSPPPSGSTSAPPPFVTPGTPPVSQIPPPSRLSPPSPATQTTVPSPPSSPGNKSSIDGTQTVITAPSNGGIGSGGTVAIGVVAGVLILGLIGLMALWMYKRKKRSSGANDGHVIPASIGSSPRSDIKLLVKTEYPPSHFGGGSGADTPTDHGGFGHSRSWFTYQELSEATGGFSDENLLGEGGFGCVYKGLLTDGRVVAVKQLKIGGGQGEREFKAEVEIISRIHHRHLVSLVGYCIWESKRLLVYDYVSNNTLYFHLHGGTRILDWATRIKIAAGAARGIAYLHEDCHPRIIHRDIKSSNILLDNNFEAQVSDFGLAKLAMDADTHISTRVMGTFGYMAPEYATTGKLTEKSDVYSFGVVLLELITGRKPVDESQPLGDESLVEWARPLLSHALDKGEFESVVDPRLEKNYIESEMFRMIEAAAACVRHSAAKRPRMGQVVRAFSISDSGDLSNGLRVGESQLYDSAQQSAEIRWFKRMAFGSQDISSDYFSQNPGFSIQSRQNVNLSAQHGQGGHISRQHSQDSQIPGFSSQGVDSGNVSADHGLGTDVSRQHSHNTYHSIQRNQNFSSQGGQNLNLYREDSLNR